MNVALKVAMVSVLALSTAAPALAQYPYQPTPQYREDLQRYQQDREAYAARREGYEAAREEYQRRLDAYNRARADYDARYGYGAYARYYGPAPVWDEGRWAYNTPTTPYYAPTTPYYAPAAPYYGANTAYTAPPIPCDNDTTVTAGVIGAIAGAVLGSNVAARNARTEGAVLGGVVGAGVGAAVGHAHDRYKCDQRGPYFSYNETIPYRESYRNRTDRYSYYQQMGCRLATAPVDSYGQDYRYVRVCPDRDGRYRIVG